MFERLAERGAQLAQARQAQAADGVAAAVGGMLPGASVSVEGTDVVASGTGLLRRWLNSAELRFLASAVR